MKNALALGALIAVFSLAFSSGNPESISKGNGKVTQQRSND